ncbi:MAG TPA: GNAT family N-acetyltransferase, partial [Actinomycetota bacterium]|nr:GNAT family N-acetyltransferase [Actinomycetota bacterium]
MGETSQPAGVSLRGVTWEDVDTFFQHQLDLEANQIAGLRPRQRDEFEAHWRRIFDDPEVLARAVVVDGRLAGQVVSFPRDGVREVGYWIGKGFSGRGVATSAMRLFLEEIEERPLHARVTSSNRGSIRVL